MADPLEEAEALHARAQALRAAGDLPGAVAALEELCALRPEHPNALNLAGWLLATGLAQPERGIAFFQRAVALFPDELTPLANLVETLAKLGRAAEALEAVGPAVGKNPRWAEAWNLSGWLKAMKLGRVDEGLADLRKALDCDHRLGDARLNLARALTVKGDLEAAYEQFRLSTVWGSFRTHEAFAALGQLDEAKGRLRRALGNYRQAARLDAGGEYRDALHLAITRVGNALLARGQFFLHAEDEERRHQYLRQHGHLLELNPVPAATLAGEAASLSARLTSAPQLEALALIRANLDARLLLPASSDQSPALALGELPEAGPLLEGYFATWMLLYDALLDAEEPGGGDPGPKARLYRLGAQHRWIEALAMLRRWDSSTEEGITSRGWIAEQLGDLARQTGASAAAAEFWALSEDAYAEYASGATAGGEGLARMVDVNRVRAKNGR